jgi:acetate kinase
VAGEDGVTDAPRSAGVGRVLVVNSGSSSLKLRVLDPDDTVVVSVDLGPIGRDADGLDAAVADLGPFGAVGHRIVHGGTRFTRPVRVDASVVEGIRSLTDLAPLHQPASVAALEALGRALPSVPAVACFDTAFHASLPPAASTYALPRAWRSRWDLRRYGFHGLSHAYASARASELLGSAPGTDDVRVVTCHLGAGASLAAVRAGRSIDTTMGFTPLEGLVMATRSGTVDPGLVVWLAEHGGLSPSELGEGLELRSGLAGLAGSADMREVLTRAAAGDADASLALDVYLHRLRAAIAAMVASLGGLDALVFTGGVGERSAPIRAMAAEGLGFLGIGVDPARNEDGDADHEISSPGAAPRVFVIAAREDVQIAREVRSVLGRPADAGR